MSNIWLSAAATSPASEPFLIRADRVILIYAAEDGTKTKVVVETDGGGAHTLVSDNLYGGPAERAAHELVKLIGQSAAAGRLCVISGVARLVRGVEAPVREQPPREFVWKAEDL